ncbi:hypothetical protein GJAV_G00120590, partial [Gymnothorax javanicus]
MKSDGLGGPGQTSDAGKNVCNKPGEAEAATTRNAKDKSKSATKPAERGTPSKTRAAIRDRPEVNGVAKTEAAGGNAGAGGVANGVRGSPSAKDRKPPPGTRPKAQATSAPTPKPTKVLRASSGKDSAPGPETGVPHTPFSASTSGSASPENSSGSPAPGHRQKAAAKAVIRSPVVKTVQKPDISKTNSTANKTNVKEASKARSTASARTVSGTSSPKTELRGRSTPTNGPGETYGVAKKLGSPRKEDGKESPKVATGDKSMGESAKKRMAKTTPASGTDTKTSTKPTKVVPSAAKSSPQTGGKPVVKQKSTPTESPTAKGSPKAAGPEKQPMSGLRKQGAKAKESSTKKVPASKSKAEPEVTPPEGLSQAGVEVLEHAEKAGGTALPSLVSTLPGSDGVEGTNPPQKVDVRPAASATGVVQLSESRPAPTLAQTIGVTPNPACVESSRSTEGAAGKQVPGRAIPPRLGSSHGLSSTNSPRDTCPLETPGSQEESETPLEDSWSGPHPQVSPESETGSAATTSSDDIKPRSEDYDAGGSQDDDGSNDRGVSKCGTVLCHDFLGRSSSDTSTPEELKMYDAGLRAELRLRARDMADPFHGHSTSEEEVTRRRPRSWLHREEAPEEEDAGEEENTVTVKNVPNHQLFSSDEEEEEEDETEDERSEVEIPEEALPPPADPSPHQFQGIINLAFEDIGEQANDAQGYKSAANFRRSVLLSVDECEELGCEEGGTLTPPRQSECPLSPGDVFNNSPRNPGGPQQDFFPSLGMQDSLDGTLNNSTASKDVKSVHMEKSADEHAPIQKEFPQFRLQVGKSNESGGAVFTNQSLDHNTCDLRPQERPSRLDLQHTEQYPEGGSLRNATDERKKDFHLDLSEHQLSGGCPSTNTAPSPAGDCDACDTL